MYFENLPFRFDTRGIIYNKRAHVYKVNIRTKKFTKIIDGDTKDIISIESFVEGDEGLVLSFDQYNHKGTMLEEKIGAIKGSKIKEIYSKGSMGNLFYYEDELHAVGMRKRFDWPTNTTVLKISKAGKVSFKYHSFDRNIVKAEVNESNLYFLYEDSGKTLLRDGTNNIDLINSEITIKDFAFNNEKTYVIANSFSNPDEVYELNNAQLTKISKANEFFTKKVKTWDCQYERIDTGKSEIDTWGIFVGKDKPTILNIHGGPASQYAFTFFDEFQTYASAGFNVIACNPRGSSGRGHDFLRDVCGNKWGITDLHDVLTSFKNMKKVKDHLNEQKFWDIFTISEDASLFEAATLMYKNKIGALMINEAGSEEHLSKSSVVGILTERDLVYALSGGSKAIESKNVKDVMTRKLIFTCPDTDNSEAKKIMLENQIRHLPVFSGENLVGIVSMRDVFKA